MLVTLISREPLYVTRHHLINQHIQRIDRLPTQLRPRLFYPIAPTRTAPQSDGNTQNQSESQRSHSICTTFNNLMICFFDILIQSPTLQGQPRCSYNGCITKCLRAQQSVSPSCAIPNWHSSHDDDWHKYARRENQSEAPK